MRFSAAVAGLLFLCISSNSAERDLISVAEDHLFAHRSGAAALCYRKLLQEQPAAPIFHDRLVRALLNAHHAEEAYAAADNGTRSAPDTAPVWTAQGRVAFRQGDLARAEKCYRKAANIDAQYPDALAGLANIYRAASQFKSAANLVNAAFAIAPRDPDFLVAHTRTISGPAQEAELKAALSELDPGSAAAQSARSRLAAELAMKGRKRKMIGDISSATIRLVRLIDGPRRVVGTGIDVRFNDRATLHLKLDTGASGISISPEGARRAGLEILTEDAGEVHGLGDKAPEKDVEYLADRVRIGGIEWENYPVSTFRAAKDSTTDGLIGADVFSAFHVTIDFYGSLLTLERRAGGESGEEPVNTAKRPEGFSQMYRFGHMLLIPTYIDDGPAKLFLIDSGSMINLIDIRAAKEATTVSAQSNIRLGGVQGEVKDVRRAQQITLRFAGLRQQNPDLTAVNLNSMSDGVGVEISGVIGMPVLWHVKLEIDYPSGSVRMERIAQYQ